MHTLLETLNQVTSALDQGLKVRNKTQALQSLHVHFTDPIEFCPQINSYTWQQWNRLWCPEVTEWGNHLFFVPPAHPAALDRASSVAGWGTPLPCFTSGFAKVSPMISSCPSVTKTRKVVVPTVRRTSVFYISLPSHNQAQKIKNNSVWG